ncbi:hypothetical protein HY633_00465 [Candidatus Uhrbacteria bacterium]|nr:hypothetical protein [Candidatus Uhrbacteria bacterium]
MMETCLCTKRSLEFTSQFAGDVVSSVYCPECVERASDDTIVFELCEPGEFAGVWGVRYNRGELKRLDEAFRDADDYFLSLLISGVCGPAIARDYRRGGLCRILGFIHGPSEEMAESALNGNQRVIADEEKPTRLPKKTRSGPRESAARSKRRI